MIKGKEQHRTGWGKKTDADKIEKHDSGAQDSTVPTIDKSTVAQPPACCCPSAAVPWLLSLGCDFGVDTSHRSGRGAYGILYLTCSTKDPLQPQQMHMFIFLINTFHFCFFYVFRNDGGQTRVAGRRLGVGSRDEPQTGQVYGGNTNGQHIGQHMCVCAWQPHTGARVSILRFVSDDAESSCSEPPSLSWPCFEWSSWLRLGRFGETLFACSDTGGEIMSVYTEVSWILNCMGVAPVLWSCCVVRALRAFGRVGRDAGHAGGSGLLMSAEH